MLHMSHMWMPYIPLCAISDPTIRIKMILKKKSLKLFHIEKSRMSYQKGTTPNPIIFASLYFSGILLFYTARAARQQSCVNMLPLSSGGGDA